MKHILLIILLNSEQDFDCRTFTVDLSKVSDMSRCEHTIVFWSPEAGRTSSPSLNFSNQWAYKTKIYLQLVLQYGSIMKCVSLSNPLWEGGENEGLVGSCSSKTRSPGLSRCTPCAHDPPPSQTRQKRMKWIIKVVVERDSFSFTKPIPLSDVTHTNTASTPGLWQLLCVCPLIDEAYSKCFFIQISGSLSALCMLIPNKTLAERSHSWLPRCWFHQSSLCGSTGHQDTEGCEGKNERQTH